MTVEPFTLKDTPALIEHLLPVQKLSIEAYKEQMAVHGKTLTALGSYWKGRKPLILNKACILGSLLPATNNHIKDLEIFEMLMGMDNASFAVRWKKSLKPEDILERVSIAHIRDFFLLNPNDILPQSSPIDWANPEFSNVKVDWRDDISLQTKRELEGQILESNSYQELVKQSYRPEEVFETIDKHIWKSVNNHLGTEASSIIELVEQLGIMRFGHRPKFADTFCGSGQIPFEAARVGCDVYASDLNPVACMLTWGAFNIVGATQESYIFVRTKQQELLENVQREIDRLGIETDGHGWRSKVFLYCLEARCPQTGWMVPLLPTFVISKNYHVIAELIPDPKNKRYIIEIKSEVSKEEIRKAKSGTIRSDGQGQDPYMVHEVEGVSYKTKISTLRGDFRREDGSTGNRLRQWKKSDFKPKDDDIFKERLYCVQWMRPKNIGHGSDYEFRKVTVDDLSREQIVERYIEEHIIEWQDMGWLPENRIEAGDKTDEPIRTRGWTHWHHLFNPRQLLLNGLIKKYSDSITVFGLTQVLNNNCRSSRWNSAGGGGGLTSGIYDNQALNTLYNYGCRGSEYAASFLLQKYKNFPFKDNQQLEVKAIDAKMIDTKADLFITDPPYGDAVKYEEILEFFIAWLRNNPPREFANWIWDSRRALAIKGEGENFRKGMVDAYSAMTDHMPDNGIQVIMFTHQSGAIWADMANIVWASGLQVTAAWYVVTETDSALREGSYVKGTVLLVCRKRHGELRTTRDDLAWEVQEEVDQQIQTLSGLNQEAKGLYRDENVFEDADIQMAGYAAALRTLTRYKIIDGRDMTKESLRPRVKGETTFVDELINFAVDTANQRLVPQGISKIVWEKLNGAERFYLKMLELEARGAKTLDNYQNFAKAFKVRDFKPFLASHHANDARLNSALEFGRAEMNEGSEFYQSTLRALLYGIMELTNEMDGNEVLAHLVLNIPNYYNDITSRITAIEIAEFLIRQLEILRPEEARSARILSELLKNQRLG